MWQIFFPLKAAFLFLFKTRLDSCMVEFRICIKATVDSLAIIKAIIRKFLNFPHPPTVTFIIRETISTTHLT